MHTVSSWFNHERHPNAPIQCTKCGAIYQVSPAKSLSQLATSLRGTSVLNHPDSICLNCDPELGDSPRLLEHCVAHIDNCETTSFTPIQGGFYGIQVNKLISYQRYKTDTKKFLVTFLNPYDCITTLTTMKIPQSVLDLEVIYAHLKPKPIKSLTLGDQIAAYYRKRYAQSQEV